MTTATYTSTFQIQKNGVAIELSPELDILIDRVFEEYREEQADKALQIAIENDPTFHDRLELFKQKVIP